MKNLVLTGLNHKTASVEARERFALGPADAAQLSALRRVFTPEDEPTATPFSVLEHMVLSTCNRVEVIAVCQANGESSGNGEADRPSADGAAEHILRLWAKVKGASVEELRPHTYTFFGPEVVEHALSVAAGLDSMILGEPQILGQIKDAYREAAAGRSSGLIINRLMHKAFFTAKRVRSETDIARNPVSVSYAAVELARRAFADMAGINCLLLGAGDTAELTAQHLLAAGVRSITVANRTLENAETLAKRYQGRAVSLADMEGALLDADIIISSTSAEEVVLSAAAVSAVMKKRRARPMFFVDIAVPRDIDPAVGALPNVSLHNIDDLKNLVEENLSLREKEAVKARAIIREEQENFLTWLKSLDLQPTIVDLIQRGEVIAKEELDKALKRIAPLPQESVEVLQGMVLSVVKKLHHEPVTFLKQSYSEEEAGALYLDMARRMFNLDE